MITPSINWCGTSSISGRSLQVPGSLSSALHKMYLGFARFLGHEAPFHAGREAGAAAAAQVRFFHFFDHLFGGQLFSRPLQALVAVILQINIELCAR